MMPRAALSRIAEGEHPIKLERGDRVVFSSRHIPGNEIAIGRVMNLLAEREVETITERQAHIHVSGHPGQPELKLMYEWVRPELLIPVHGEIRHLIANAKLAISTGIPAENVIVAEDGDVVDLAKGRARRVGRIDASYIFVDGQTVGDISDSLTDRMVLGEEGFISIISVVSLHTKELVSGPDIHARGFAEDESVFDGVRLEVAKAIRDALEEGVEDTQRLQQITRRVMGAWVSRKLRRRPMIVPVVVST